MKRGLSFTMVFMLIIAVIPGCSASRADNRFRTNSRQALLQECTARASRSVVEKEARSYCTCAADKAMQKLSTPELIALGLGMAPRSVLEKANAIDAACVGASPPAHARHFVPANPCEADAYVTNPVQPNFPRSARSIDHPITSEIVVTVAPSGRLETARVYRSSGYPDADSEALRAAKASSYAPKVIHCRRVEGRYLFRADFDPD